MLALLVGASLVWTAHAFRPLSARTSWPLQAAVTTSLTPPALEVLPASFDPKLLQLNRLLVDLWDKIAFPTQDDSDTYFRISDYSLTRADLKGFLKHFQVCRDCAAESAYLMASADENGQDVLQLTNVYFPDAVEEDSDDDWGNFDKTLLGVYGYSILTANATTLTLTFYRNHDDAVLDAVTLVK